MLHELPHVPVQVVFTPQLNEQLPPLHPELPMSHAVPASHVHDVPVHCGGGGGSSPHAATGRSINKEAIMTWWRLARHGSQATIAADDNAASCACG